VVPDCLAHWRVARGCQLDPECWADTLTTCERLITAFDALNPEHLVEQMVMTLGDAGMLRDGDLERAMSLRQWYATRQSDLPMLLDRYRVLPDVLGQCADGLERCYDDTCGTTAQCETRMCEVQQRWCPELGAWIDAKDECFTCDGEGAIFCPVSNSCELSVDVCSAACAQIMGEGALYCESLRRCASDFECVPDIDTDGGVDVPLFDSGVIPF